jgi:hypothetical protein
MAKATFWAGLGLLVLTVAGCARPGGFPTPEGGPASTQVVIVSAAGKIATSTSVGGGTRIPATPTFDPGFGSILTPLAQTPVAGPASSLAQSPTPELRPTRTPAPSVTPFPTFELPPTPERVGRVFEPPPTRTPSPPTPIRPGVGPPTRVPTVTPTATVVDPNGSIGDLASAKPIGVGQDVTGLMNGLKAINVFSFEVAEEDEHVVVSLTGRDIEHYRLYLISPGRSQSAFGQVLGASGRVIRYPVRGEAGTWFVEVSTDGKKVPSGSYSLRVDVRGPTGAGA